MSVIAKFSDKQLLSIANSTASYNFWIGAVSSGKTFASEFALKKAIDERPPGDVMVLGVSRATIQRNILNDFFENILGISPPTSKMGSCKVYGETPQGEKIARNMHFVGAHDESAIRIIQGSSLVIAYVDEVTCMPYAVFKMLESRLRKPGAILLATGNPEGPAHWLKKEYIDKAKERNFNYWHFTLEDNLTLEPSYVENLKKSYHGMWYARYIKGEWAVAHGLVYDGFDDLNEYEDIKLNPMYYVVGIDYGTSNATSAVLVGIHPKMWPHIQVVDEYYYDSAKEGRAKTNSEYVDDLYKFIQYYNVQKIFIDPSAASLKAELSRKNLPVVDGNNDVVNGIRIVGDFFYKKNLVIHKKCTNLLDQIKTYAWDAKASDKGEDKPVKKNDHAVDALRYAIASEFPLGTIEDHLYHKTIEEIKKEIYSDPNDPFGFNEGSMYR